MNLILFSILGALFVGDFFISWHLVHIISIGSYWDGPLAASNFFFGLYGNLAGGVLGFLLWLFSRKIKREKKVRFWLVNITILVVVCRILLGSFILPPVVAHARGNNLIFLKIYDLFSDDYNVRDLNGMTALSKACLYGKFEAANFLIEAGAPLEVQDKRGFSALMHSAHGLGGIRSSFQADKEDKEYCKIATHLIQHGANVHLTNFAEQNALILAAQVADDCIIKALLKTNIDINHADFSGRTAIEYAARYKDDFAYKIVVNKLLKAGAKL